MKTSKKTILAHNGWRSVYPYVSMGQHNRGREPGKQYLVTLRKRESVLTIHDIQTHSPRIRKIKRRGAIGGSWSSFSFLLWGCFEAGVLLVVDVCLRKQLLTLGRGRLVDWMQISFCEWVGVAHHFCDSPYLAQRPSSPSNLWCLISPTDSLLALLQLLLGGCPPVGSPPSKV